jgi:hypothetical protein
MDGIHHEQHLEDNKIHGSPKPEKGQAAQARGADLDWQGMP